MPQTEFFPFESERYQSDFEGRHGTDLSGSGGRPLRLVDLEDLKPGTIARLSEEGWGYPPVPGTEALRAGIAVQYPGASPENVLVTVGAAEANLIATTGLVAPGDRIAAMVPHYLQIHGIARNLGATVDEIPLRPDRGWALDLDVLDRAVGEKTKLIAICSPNNPTGRVLDTAERAAVIAAADRVGAWILSDEVYTGLERDAGAETASLWGDYDKVVAVGSLSKALGLPGARIGWLVAPRAALQLAWRRHEYAVISAGSFDMAVAEVAFDPAVRPALVARARGFLASGFDKVAALVARHPNRLSVTEPQATSLCFIGLGAGVGGADFARRLREERDTLVMPGSVFGGQDFDTDGFVRITHAVAEDRLERGLAAIEALLN
ncbi:MAG: aminotransferase class I/II-fold pyridoxal phosphate-dependent enzyme [Alphaproteobacteria bacterium]|nr:aminotransferase class I/II-fold pyridoxal phosphate-dependent enzyme [Alphaproteobacteria bacterium]